MEAFLATNDKKMFQNYLDKATHQFEQGSGGSTQQASIRNNIQKIWSVESDIQWYNKLKGLITTPKKFTQIQNEMDAKPNNQGNPGPNATNEQKRSQSNHLTQLPKSEAQKIDLLMIDGRFRVACCMKSMNHIRDDCLIAFDDFLNRPIYHSVLKQQDIVEQTSDKRMVILKKKPSVKEIPASEIEKQEMVAN